jgi:hypothetical protein
LNISVALLTQLSLTVNTKSEIEMDCSSQTVEVVLDPLLAVFLLRLAAELRVPPKELIQSAFEAGLLKHYGNN